MTPDEIEGAVAAGMPQAVQDLKRLASIPSIAFPGHPEEAVYAAAAMTEELLRSAGLPHVRQIPVEGSFPAVYAEAPAPPGAPTVLLYAHYDVQPPGDPALWRTPAFEPTEIDGSIYGRGVADDKSGVISHVAALRAFRGRFPVGIKVIIEGQEEYAGERLEAFVEQNPELVRADAIVVADTGNPRVGDPSVTTSLRGMGAFTVEVRTLKESLHSGSFGGAAPDALSALIRMLAALHDDNGDIRVPGLPRGTFLGSGALGGGVPGDRGRARRGVPGRLRLAGRPAVGLLRHHGHRPGRADGLRRDQRGPGGRAGPGDRARASGGRPEDDRERRGRLPPPGRPLGRPGRVSDFTMGTGFLADTGGAARTALNRAMERAYGRPPRDVGAGGSIPLVSTFVKQFPAAEILLFGAEDDDAAIHAPNERVDLEELRRTATTEALFLQEYGSTAI